MRRMTDPAHGLQATVAHMRPVSFVCCVVLASSACGPSILTVAPNVQTAGGLITIEGGGLDEGAIARLEQGGAAVQLQITQQTPSSITARLPSATPAGRYDVVVDIGGVVARADDALTVTAGRAVVRFLDVGQGDATIIVGKNHNMLIDGGPQNAAATVAEAVREVGGVDHVAVTHTDADHLAGIVQLLSGDDGTVGTSDDLIPQTRWIGHADAVCDSLLCGRLRSLQARFQIPVPGDEIDLGDVTVTVLGADGDFGAAGRVNVNEENERSLTMLVRAFGKTVFIGGDLTGGGLGSVDVEATAARASGPVDVLRLNHHGSATSSSVGFLDALQPSAIVVSQGTNNSFCHPERNVVTRLAETGARVFSTGSGNERPDQCGGVTPWPVTSRTGLGSFDLVIDADGAITIDDEPL